MQRRSSVLSCLSARLRGRCRLWNAAGLLAAAFSAAFCLLLLSNWWHHTSVAHRMRLQMKLLNSSWTDPAHKNQCSFYTCFEISCCVFSMEDVLGVYVGEWYDFISPHSPTLSPKVSSEYAELVEAVKESRYYVSDPSKACVFIPSVDTLSQSSVEVETMSTLLNSLPQWNGGLNYLIFNMLPGDPPHFNATPDYYYGKAMLASAGTTPNSYRMGFDVSIPVYNPLTKSDSLIEKAASSDRQYLLTVIDHGDLEGVYPVPSDVDKDVLLLQTVCRDIPMHQLPRKRCGFKTDHTYSFPDVLLSSKFCLLLSGAKTGMLDFTDMMMTGCIPVTVSDTNLPFFEVLDWALASISCPSCDLKGVVKLLRGLPEAMIVDWRRQVLYLYRQYFSSMASIVMTTLNILNERIFPVTARSYDWWNTGRDVSHIARDLEFLPPPKNEGFTTVILTYDRVSSLFKVIENVAKAPSCVRILVVWNNVEKTPPPASQWPQIKQPIQVIRSRENKLSNRFYPYDNLTSAVFSLDDDITMLTVDELEFGFKAWQEFPNRLVGFPSRVHIQLPPSEDGHPRWKYESEWLNNISFVLTGAAFYHKYYNHLYTYEMPRQIREWVDDHLNCEDIAMNFLISNYTGLPPLKVSPRKKFVCPTCTSEESLWNDAQHYKERDQCINIFGHFFEDMPLKTVKFRLDPILYKSKVPDELLAYPKMGEL